MTPEPKLGDRASCRLCSKPVEYIGPYWLHVEGSQRHPATPAGLPRPGAGAPPVDSVEQAVRDILSQAIAAGLVHPAADNLGNPNPQAMTAGDLVGPAEVLAAFLARVKANRKKTP